ncbi:MAG: hypothetical protein E7158_02485 [Firmicutes bacterium]|nr:hypothetical protein [Bacillota bacterium]
MKFKNIIFSIAIFIFSFVLLPEMIYAKNHSFDLEAYYCDKSVYNSSDDVTNYENCLTDYAENGLTSYKKEDGDQIDNGSIMLFIVNYRFGPAAEVNGFNFTYYYDDSKWTPGLDGTDLYIDEDIYDITDGLLKKDSNGKASWTYTSSVDLDSNSLNFVLVDNNTAVSLNKDYVVGYFFMKVKDGVNGRLSIDPTTDFMEVALTNPDADEITDSFDYTEDLKGISFTTGSSTTVSTDATLDTLTVTKSGTNYFAPEFVSGSETLNYTVYVPYSVDSIDLQATPHDSEATIGDENGTGLGVKNLSVGAQTYNIVVYSKAGNSLTYAVTVYRLNHDATIKNLSFTNSVGFPATNEALQNTFEYETTVPYATKDTTPSAVPNDSNASIKTGLSKWTISKVGENIFTITAEAEDCAYPTIQNNAYANCGKQTYTFKINKEAPSTNTYLSTITKAYTVNGVKETASQLPGYVKTKKDYDLGEVSFETTKVTLNAAVEASGKAKIRSSDLGEKTLNVGLNEFEINVTAEDGTPDKYTIKIYRKSANNYLKTLTVTSTPAGHGSLNTTLVKTTNTGYRFNYDEIATKYTVYAEVEDTDKASVSIFNTNGTVGSASKLNNNTYTFDITNPQVLITVTAEDGKINTYTLDAGRTTSADSTLKSLDITSGSGDTYTEYTLTPEFPDPTTRNYALTVESDVSEVSINAIPTSVFASIKEIKGNYENLSFDNVNKIEVVVEAEDHSTSSYTIDITRKKYAINTLKELNVTLNGETYNLTEDLDPDKLNYELAAQIPYSIDGTKVTSVQVNATPTDETYATVTGTGSRTIHTGSQVLDIVVKAHDQTPRTYKLTVVQKKNTDNSIKNFTIRGIAPTLKEETADVSTYEMEVDNSITEVKPTDVVFTLPDGATKSVNQTLELKTKQDNIYTFTVTSENGDVHEYDVNIKRTSNASNNISLVTLTIGTDSSRTCVMSADNSCVIEVPVDTTSFKLSATIADTATISPANGTEYDLPASTSSKTVPLTVTAENGEIKEYTVNVQRAKSSNNDLSALTINGKTIAELTDNNKTFNATTTSYDITLEGTISKAIVNATVADTDKAKLDIVNATNSFNEDNLEYTINNKEKEFDLTQDKVNVIRVYVKAENGQQKYYTLNITRALRTNALLSDLTYNGVTITGFEPTKYEYTLPDVIYNIPTVTIGATTQDAAATKGGDGVLSINTGDNTITVTVTAQDKKTTQDYIIHIKRAKNSDTGIKGMTLAGVQAKKNNETGNYEVTVPNSVTEANHDNLVVTVNDPKVETDAKATVTFTDQALFTEDNHPNIIPITVKAEDGTEKEYTLLVTRTKSNIATLTNILIKDVDGDVIGSFGTKPFVADKFTPDEEDGIVMTYNVTVPVDTTDFVIEAVKTEPHETIVGDGRYTLDTTANDSVTTKTVTVTSEDTKVVHNYVLNITRNKSSDNFLKSITVTSEDGNTTYALSPEFTQSGTSYTVNVNGDVEKVVLNAEKNDNRASIDDEENILTTHDLQVGDNKFDITVRSESGSPNTYKINIIRALKPYNSLGKIIVNNDTILDKENDVNKFNDENKYTLTEVPYKTTKIGYTLEAEDSDATVEVKVKNEAGVVTTVTGNEILLSTGINEITVTVTAQNSMKKIYTVFITRIKNNDATLKTITVKNIKGTQSEVITVTEDTDTYYVTVDEKKEKLYSLEVLYAKSDAKAEVTLDSDLDLVTSNAGVFPNEFNIHVVAEDGEAYHDYKLLVRRPKSSDTRIKEIELSGATNESTFKDNIYTYTLDIPYNSDTFTIRGVPYVSTTTVEGNFTYTYYIDDEKNPHLSYIDNGETKVIDGNKVTLKAIAENGDEQDYVFTIKSAKTDDTVITNLQVIDQPFTATFTQNITDYTLKNELDVSIDALKVVATTRNASATYVCILDGVTYDCQNNNLPIPAVAGTKTITVVITSASGTKTKEYYINYTKVYSSDATLSQLQMVQPNIDLGFNSTTPSYSVNVNNEVVSAKFQFDTNDPNATVYINDEELVPSEGIYEYTLSNLAEGENTLTIKVKAQDQNAEETYTVVVNRAEKEASNDAYLDSLEVEGYPFTEEFEMEKYVYDLGEIPYKVNSLNVIAHANYTKSKISYNLDGKNAQDNGTLSIPVEDGEHIIYVNVVAENGTDTNSYRIKYTKEASKNNLLKDVSLDNATLEFDPDTNTYNVEVDTDTKTMIATIQVDDPRSTVQIGATTYTAPNDSAIVYNMPTLSPGDNKLQIIVIPESSVPANIYEINIKRQKDELITSFEFGHVIEDGYIKTGILGESGLDMKNELDNKNEHLQIMNADETREISDSEQVATGYIVKLMVDNIEQDRKTIVVKGDVNGDGNITLIDAVGTINHYVGVQNNDTTKRRLVGEYFVAADTNTNGGVSLIDAVGIINHYTNKTKLSYKR